MNSIFLHGRTRQRTLFVCSCLTVLTGAGCGSGPPAPVAAESSASSSDTVAAVPAPVTPVPIAAPQPSPVTSPPITPAPAVDPALRDLAARLVVSDGHGGWRRDEQAATDLEKIGPEGLDRMWPLLQDAAADVRRGAAFALLEAIDPADSKQAAAFAALLDDKDATIRGLGLAAMKETRRENQVAALPSLAAMLDPAREEKVDNRATVARLLASLKTDAGPVLEKVVAAAGHDPDAKVRTACLVAISQIAPPQQSAVPLARGLTDQDPAVRQVAVARLRQFGAAAAPAAKELAALLADDGLRESVAEVLILIGAPAVQPIAGQLASKNAEVRKYALACLAKIGPAAKDALPAVEKCRQDPDDGVRTLAATALRHIQGK